MNWEARWLSPQGCFSVFRSVAPRGHPLSDQRTKVARLLVRRLSEEGIDVPLRVDGDLEDRVEIGLDSSRWLGVDCFWYDRELHGLILGMNPANDRARLGRKREVPEGAEYKVSLHEGPVRLGEGRTRQVEEVVACVRAWVGGVNLHQLVNIAAFVDAKPRALRAVAARLDPRLRWGFAGDWSPNLWVYGQGRSCMIEPEGAGMACTFFVGQAQVARASAPESVEAAVSVWLLDEVPVIRLPAIVPSVDLERHAEMLEQDPARWHWLHMQDRMNDPTDVLQPLRALIEVLARSPICSRYFTYSSLDRLCFSASSHYPWVNRGLPIVTPHRDGVFEIEGGGVCDLRGSVERIESTLLAYPVKPFFGSSPHHELPRLAEALKRLGGTATPRLLQEGYRYELVVGHPQGPRRCIVDGSLVKFEQEGNWVRGWWPTLDEAVPAIIRFLERGVTLKEIHQELQREGSQV